MTKIDHPPTITILHNGEERKVKQAAALASGNEMAVKDINLNKEALSETQLDLFLKNFEGDLSDLIKKEFHSNLTKKSEREILTLLGNNSQMLNTPLATCNGKTINMSSPRSILTFSKSDKSINPYNHKNQ